MAKFIDFKRTLIDFTDAVKSDVNVDNAEKTLIEAAIAHAKKGSSEKQNVIRAFTDEFSGYNRLQDKALVNKLNIKLGFVQKHLQNRGIIALAGIILGAGLLSYFGAAKSTTNTDVS